ncbi:hypothetical protein CEXT_277801 [Caerostris extrusa]|uniref:Uncharacterized protein n=1 Tax=Caerostris extrusa TaxID=172846 RepID=A0AAV4TSG7_CAEEX|nr:hypothetical protein CEXT_277801 [Caerostris extrusa]
MVCDKITRLRMMEILRALLLPTEFGAMDRKERQIELSNLPSISYSPPLKKKGTEMIGTCSETLKGRGKGDRHRCVIWNGRTSAADNGVTTKSSNKQS